MQKRYFAVLFVGLLGLFGGLLETVQATAISAKVVHESMSTADHSRFQELDRKFASGPEVTRACLKCHNLAGLQFHDTIHWTWAGRKTDKKGEGKVKTLNNF